VHVAIIATINLQLLLLVISHIIDVGKSLIELLLTKR